MLDPGTPAPDLELRDQDGNLVRLRGYMGHPVVLFFYPKDDTRICTSEACGFRDAYTEFTELGAVVLGISGDGADSHRAFAERWNLPFRLLCDTQGAARKAFRVPRTLGLLPGRVTYVIDHQGVIRAAINDPFKASRHVREALAALKHQRTG
jgi:peroxiredoxin Q/BCP